jgi:CHAT domain-containing protein
MERPGFRRPRRPLLAAGPGLPGARDELNALGALYPGATRLDADDSRVDAVLGALVDCDLAHLACHGAFRRDNPLFSTLTLADGPLTMYDLEGLERLPELFVLSACDAAASSVLAGGALLGLTAGLVAFGARAVVAPLNPVHDLRTPAVMERLHRHLAAGIAVDEALAATIASSEGDEEAAAMSFIAVAG